MKRSILNFGIILLFIVSAITPMVFGYNAKTTDTNLIKNTDEYYAFDRYDKYCFPENYSPEKHILSVQSDDVKLELSADSKETTNPSLVGKEQEESSSMLTSDGPMDSPWPMKCHDTRHTGRSPYSTADNTGVEKWRFEADASVDGGTVIDNDGTIYFGDKHYYFYAVNPDGSLKWKTLLDDWVWSAPAIAEDGTIYIGSWDDYLHAFNPDGTVKWRFNAGGQISSSPAIAEDGTIYFGTWYDFVKGDIVAVNPDGTEKWRYATGDLINSEPAIGDDGTIYIGSDDYYLYAMYPDGTLRWRFETGSYVKATPSIADDGTIYFGSYDLYLYALNPDGSLKWKEDYLTNGHPAIGEDGTIYVGGKTFYAIRPDGSLKWSFELWPDDNHRFAHGFPAISADGTIYVGTEIGEGKGGEILAINSDGTERWRKMIANNWVWSSPCIAEDGTMYIGSSSNKLIDKGYADSVGYLHAFGTVETNEPPDTPIITGTTNGKTGAELYYRFSAIDPDRNPVQFYVDWGDGAITDWTGGGSGFQKMEEAASGENIYIEHTYMSEGSYTIKAKARDAMGEESDWAELSVTMPKNKPYINTPFLSFLEQYPILYQLLQRLLNL